MAIIFHGIIIFTVFLIKQIKPWWAYQLLNGTVFREHNNIDLWARSNCASKEHFPETIQSILETTEWQPKTSQNNLVIRIAIPGSAEASTPHISFLAVYTRSPFNRLRPFLFELNCVLNITWDQNSQLMRNNPPYHSMQVLSVLRYLTETRLAVSYTLLLNVLCRCVPVVRGTAVTSHGWPVLHVIR